MADDQGRSMRQRKTIPTPEELADSPVGPGSANGEDGTGGGLRARVRRKVMNLRRNVGRKKEIVEVDRRSESAAPPNEPPSPAAPSPHPTNDAGPEPSAPPMPIERTQPTTPNRPDGQPRRTSPRETTKRDTANRVRSVELPAKKPRPTEHTTIVRTPESVGRAKAAALGHEVGSFRVRPRDLDTVYTSSCVICTAGLTVVHEVPEGYTEAQAHIHVRGLASQRTCVGR